MYLICPDFSVTSSLEVLNNQSGLLALASILIAIGVFFHQQRTEKIKFKERLRRICGTLLIHLKDLDIWYKS